MPSRKLAPDKGRKKHVPREEFIYDTDGSCLRHDDTLILHPDYWGSMIATKHDAFDDPMWDEPIKQDKLTTAPGAVDFLNYCKSKGVEVFYVTSRDQGEGTYGYAPVSYTHLTLPTILRV